jgi:hypothetical protein
MSRANYPPCFRPYPRCDRCGVNLRWATTPRGKRAAFEENPAGIYALMVDDNTGEVHAIRAGLSLRRRYRIHSHTFCQPP